jgi:PAS domain S-box-containing protein
VITPLNFSGVFVWAVRHGRQLVIYYLYQHQDGARQACASPLLATRMYASMNDTNASVSLPAQLLDVCREMMTTVSWESLLHQSVEAAIRITAAEWAGLLLLDDAQRDLRLVVVTGQPDRLFAVPVPIERSIAGAAFTTGQAVDVPDAETDPRYFSILGEPVQFKVQSLLAIPLHFNQQRIGVLEVAQRRDGAAFDAVMREGLLFLAAQAATAIGQMRLIEDLRRTQTELQQQLVEYKGQLRESQENFRRIFEAAPFPLTITALDDATVFYANQSAFDFYEVTPDQLSRLTAIDVYVDSADRARIQALVQREAGFNHLQLHVRTPLTGREKWILSAGRVIQYRGRPSLLSAQVDITASRQSEEELRRAKEAAEAANRAKSLFLANMSHELRTPLNAILGFSELMARDTGLTTEQQYNLATINRSGEHLLNLINDVLDMAKIETGRVVMSLRQFDVYRLLDELADLFRLRATEKGLTLLLTRDPSLPQLIETDDKKLRQILLNLLSNAVKFTEQGGVGLRVKFADGLLWCEVQDTGPGIPPQDLETIFEPFVQTTYGLKSKEGTGLGLAISRQFAQLLGGSLTAFSTGEPGQGALFMLQLPVGVPQASVVAPSSPNAQLTVTSLEPDQPAYRILIAEDRLENSELLRLLLAKLGFEVRVAANGLEAINVWRSWQPHLILMDMRMPVLDGHEATRRIKATTPGKTTIIIALTAGVFDDEREQVRLDGCDDFLSKPFHPNDVAELLTKHLGVRFIYRSGTGPLVPSTTSMESSRSPIDLVQLAQLPAAWRTQAAQAARAADADQIMALAAQVRGAQPVLAAALTDLAFNFEYDTILQALLAVDGEA